MASFTFSFLRSSDTIDADEKEKINTDTLSDGDEITKLSDSSGEQNSDDF